MAKKKHSIDRKGGIITITQANDLISQAKDLKLWEMRIFLAVIAQIDPIKDQELGEYTIWLKDINKMFPTDSNDVYEKMREAIRSLRGKDIRFLYKGASGGDSLRSETIFISDDTYLGGGDAKKEQYIKVRINPWLKPLLIQLKNRFTSYDQRNIALLNLKSLTLFQLLKQYQAVGKREFTVEELRTYLPSEESTKHTSRFSYFNQKILRETIKNINAHTDLTVWIEYVKQSRKVTSLIFYIKAKEQEKVLEVWSVLNNGKPKQLALFETVQPVQTAPSETTTGDIITAPVEIFSSKFPLNDTELKTPYELYPEKFAEINKEFGIISVDTFNIIAQDKTLIDIDHAIQLTKRSKAVSPSGYFIDALTKGYKTKYQKDKEVKKERDEKAKTDNAILNGYKLAYSKQHKQFVVDKKEIIKKIINKNPGCEEIIIKAVKKKDPKRAYIPDNEIPEKYGLDYREEFVRQYPKEFEALIQNYNKIVAEIDRKGKEINPDFDMKA